MNPETPQTDPLLAFYDTDHPWPEDPLFAQMQQEAAVAAAVGNDIPFFTQLLGQTPGPIVDLCCGTGRITVPLARAGHEVVAVDIAPALLARLRARLEREPEEVRARVQVVQGDVRNLDLPGLTAAAAFIAFNSLCCIGDRGGQMQALHAAWRLLAPGGSLIIDIPNPLTSSLFPITTPSVTLTRHDPDAGVNYTRVMLATGLDDDQARTYHGWYDEVLPDGSLRRHPYRYRYRYLFRAEAELMLEAAGFKMIGLLGNHFGAPYMAASPKIILVASKVAASDDVELGPSAPASREPDRPLVEPVG